MRSSLALPASLLVSALSGDPKQNPHVARASGDQRDAIGAGSFRYPTVHPQYEEILARVGPMQPGQRRAF